MTRDDMKCSYYKTIANQVVLIAAPLPKPYGGIAIHAQRLKVELEKQNNTVVVYQAHQYTSKIKRFLRLIHIIWRQKPALLISHTSYHGSLESLIFVLLRVMWFQQWILVDHDCRYLFKKTFFLKSMHALSCKVADYVILMGHTVKDLYDVHAIKPKRYLIDTPYIPPRLDEVCPMSTLSLEIQLFIKNHQKTILINGSCFMKDDENRDIYGFDRAIQLLNDLKQHYPSIGLIIMLGHNNDHHYYTQLQSSITQFALTDKVLWLIGDYYLPSIVPHVALLIRPTSAENFGMSVAEAIDLGIPVIASNCCKRYPGTILYDFLNYQIFREQVLLVLQGSNQKT